MTDDERNLLLACARAISASPNVPLQCRKSVRVALAPFSVRDASPSSPAHRAEPAPVDVPSAASPGPTPVPNPHGVNAGIADGPAYAAAGTFMGGGSGAFVEHDSMVAVDGRLVPARSLK